MKKILKIERIAAILFVFFITFSSCTNELDITPKDDQDLLGDEFFANESSYKQLLAGVSGNLSLTGIDGPGS